MMAENPNCRWSLNNGSSSSLALNNSADDDDHLHNHGYPVSWTQLLVGGLASCDSNVEYSKLQVDEKHCNEILMSHGHNNVVSHDKGVSDHNYHHVKQETIIEQQQQLYDTYDHTTTDDISSDWSSCFKSLSSEDSRVTYMDFSSDHRIKRNQDDQVLLHQSAYHQCKDSSAPNGTPKKARVQPSLTQQPALKPPQVKKVRLGDRITALHQLVSPFGKTDTASVLLEAMGYIRFLEGQIQALSAPYSGNASSAGSVRKQQSVNEDELLSSTAAAGKEDLRSRGLSLVSVDWAHHVNNTIGILDINNNNGSADYWASSAL